MVSLSLSNPRVLVLLAAHNGARWIREQLDSILQQTGVRAEVLVSEDGSTDATREQLSTIAESNRVRLISPESPTGSAAQNFFYLIRSTAADGFDFVAFSDQDDVWHTDKLGRACRALVKNRADGYSSAVTAVWRDSGTRVLSQVVAPTGADFQFEGAGQGCTFVLCVEFFNRVRSFFTEHPELTRELHYHDWSVYALARAWNLPWIFDPHPTMEYRQHGENDTGARNNLAGMMKRLSLIRIGWYRKQLVGIADLCLTAVPSSPLVSVWRSLLSRPPSFQRRIQMAFFCIRYGRRRITDRAVLVLAALAGWM